MTENKGMEINCKEVDQSPYSGMQITCPLEKRIETVLHAMREGWRIAEEKCYPTDGIPILSITEPCGNSVEYAEIEDIPLVDVPCTCGNPGHYFIKYTDNGVG